MFHGVEGCPGQELLDLDPETILASVQNGAVQTFSCFVADFIYNLSGCLASVSAFLTRMMLNSPLHRGRPGGLGLFLQLTDLPQRF